MLVLSVIGGGVVASGELFDAFILNKSFVSSRTDVHDLVPYSTSYPTFRSAKNGEVVLFSVFLLF